MNNCNGIESAVRLQRPLSKIHRLSLQENIYLQLGSYLKENKQSNKRRELWQLVGSTIKRDANYIDIKKASQRKLIMNDCVPFPGN
jgi:hypothetical protein